MFIFQLAEQLNVQLKIG